MKPITSAVVLPNLRPALSSKAQKYQQAIEDRRAADAAGLTPPGDRFEPGPAKAPRLPPPLKASLDAIAKRIAEEAGTKKTPLPKVLPDLHAAHLTCWNNKSL